GRLRPEAGPPQQRGVLRAEGPWPRRARRPPHSLESRRRDAGRERLRASALQRLEGRGGDPPGVQGQAAVPVHAPAVPEDRGMAVEDPAQGGGELQAAERHLREGAMTTVFTDKGPAFSGNKTASFRADEAKASQEFRKQY